MKKLSAIILALATAFAPAIALPWLNNSASVAARATYWNFQEDIDYFAKINKYQKTDFKDYLTYAQFNTKGLEAGFALKKDIYFAASYYGNLWSINQDGATPSVISGYSLNSLNLIFGFDNFGIAAYGFYVPRMQNDSESDNSVTHYTESVFLASLGIGGMTFKTDGGLELVPFAKIGYFCGLNEFYNQTQKTHGTAEPLGYTIKNPISNIDLYVNPGDTDGHLVFDLGADLDFADKGAYSHGIWLYYNQDVAVYSPKDPHSHGEFIDFGYWGAYDIDDRFSVGYSLNPALEFDTSKENFDIGLGIPMSLGLKYAANPEKCNIYAGCLVTPILFEQSRINGTVDHTYLNYDPSTKANSIQAELGFGAEWIIAKTFTLGAHLSLPCNVKIFDNILNGGLAISAKLSK